MEQITAVCNTQRTLRPLAYEEASCRADATLPLLAFCSEFDSVIQLPAEAKDAMRADFLAAIDVLTRQGCALEEALGRVSLRRLGGMYAQPPAAWYPLDSAAKQYPLTMQKGQMPIFRMEAALDQPVEPALLQLALHFVLRRFPHYATRLRRGLFWYYLEPCPGRYAVTRDHGAVCRPIDLTDGKEQLFRLAYRSSIVILEVFHVLTDGMGAVCFLKTLLAEYYRLLGTACAYDEQTLDPTTPATDAEVGNSFSQVEAVKGKNTIIGAPAIQIPAERLPNGECKVDRLHFSAGALKDVARKQHVSITVLMSAMILQACRETARAKHGQYGLQMPMNLRRLFGTRSLRNFSWYCILQAPCAEGLSMQALLQSLSLQLSGVTHKAAVQASIASAQRLIRWLRYVPLRWKAGVMRTVSAFTGEFFFTTTLSNIGVITLPPALSAHVQSLCFVLGPSITNPYSFAMTTLGDDALLTVTRTTDSLALEEKLLALARAFGLDVCVEREENL
ncbi:hypothetical protein LJC74_01375 [Eubacteriales bacterium OttesenSCG-928-A19]|nr:hypothetical protein [Eubacteriales bacterium OttesenSCG-928-A19]